MIEKKKKPVIRLSAVLIIIVISVVCTLLFQAAFNKFNNYTNRLNVHVTCWSDRLNTLPDILDKYASEHGGSLPDPSLMPLLVENGDFFLTCAGSNTPFKWNKEMGKFTLPSSSAHLLAWCPVGSHRGYAGVVILRGENIETEVVTTQELMVWLEWETSFK